MNGHDQFHIGIVVDDFDATLDELTRLFGYEWCEPIANDTEVVLPTGETTLPMRLTYSRPLPRVEIVQSVPGTLWQPTDSGVHHAGYWSDDVAADGAALGDRGFTTEATGLAPDRAPMWAYHRSPTGLRIELVSAGLRPMLEAWWGSAP